ncbi:MAG: Uncharacterised protein [Rhodospirillaceae bacterium]|nr:MAG: Uncharacterised protein [Rhodospirillaceae bacterium]
MVVGADQQEPVVARAGDTDKESGVGLFVDQLVGVLFRAKHVPENLAGAVVVVLPGVEQRQAVRRPDRSACGAFEAIGVVLAVVQIADLQGVELRALGIHAPGHEPVIVADRCAGHAEVVVALCFLVAVEDDAFRALAGIVSVLAAVDGVLTAGAEADVVGKGAVFNRW